MAVLTIPWTFFANGTIQGNPNDAGNPLRVVPDRLAFGPFTPAPDAAVRLEINDADITSVDADGDGVVEQTVRNGVRIQSFTVDLDGDGTFESTVRGQNPNDLDLQLSNQSGSNIARLNGQLSLTDGTGAVRSLSQGNLFLANDLPFGATTGAALAPVPVRNPGANFIIGDPNNPVFPCFTAGTLIETPRGLVPVETLRPGERVLTRDHGARPLAWVGQRRFDLAALWGVPRLWPVRIGVGALGHGLPLRPLCLSPQHRVLVQSWRADLMFGTPDLLVPAAALVGRPGIRQPPPAAPVTYVHLLFAGHEIVRAEGAAVESLHPGDTALDRLGQAARDEVLAIFPALATRGAPSSARRIARGWELRALSAVALAAHRASD